MDTVERYVAALESDIRIWEAYHNHKETMAWTATAFYGPGIIVAASAASSYMGSIEQWFATAIVAVLGLAALLFVNMQFEMRWQADDILLGLRRARAQLIGGLVDVEKESRDLPKREGKRSDREWVFVWPEFIQSSIRECKHPRSARLFLSAIELLSPFRWFRIEAKLRTEVASYVFVVVSTGIAVAALWIVGQGGHSAGGVATALY